MIAPGHGHPPKLPAIIQRAPSAAGVPNFLSQDGKVTLYGIPFVRQPDGTWLCPLPNPGVTTIDGRDFLSQLRLVPANGNVTPPPPPPPPPPPLVRPSIQGLYLPDRQTKATTGRAGDSLILLGRNLGTAGNVEFGSAPAGVGTWGPGAILLQIPSVPPGAYVVRLMPKEGGSYTVGLPFTVLAP